MISTLQGLRYSLHVIFRPFDGFWDLKHEKRGNLKSALIILGLLCVTLILRRQLTGFIFNLNDLNELNVFNEIISVLLPFALWCVANWCLTSLMEGEGGFKDIVITTAYALTPLVILNVIMIIISNALALHEAAFYHFLNSLSVLWAGVLLVLGTMVLHQYSLSRTILTSVFIVVGMGVIIFIGLLFFSMLQQMFGFVYTIFLEISLRF